MTKPSDFRADTALEVDPAPVESRTLKRDTWFLRASGVVLLLASWSIVSLHNLGHVEFFINTAIFVSLGAFGYAAASLTRRNAVNIERKLRMELLVHNMELQNMAMKDDLTQLFNRRYFFERLERELDAARGFERPLSVMVIDLDAMKAVNDTYGHRVGDRLLAEFGEFLVGQTRASDVPARIGGDEFAVILPDTTREAAETLMERIIKRLEENPLLDDGQTTLKTQASFGLSGYPWETDTVDAIMQQADAAMYAQKHERRYGGEMIVPDGPGMIPQAFRRAEEKEPA